jgi:small subunit ribosomal protein S20
MANHASALKAHRQSLRRKGRNRANRSALRTSLKGFLAQTEPGAVSDNPQAAVAKLYSEVDRAARKKSLSKNAAARQKSRLTKRFNKAHAATVKS